MDRRTSIVGTAAAAAVLPHAARAQETFPTRPITILNAFPPGGINDLVTRPAASALEVIFKQPVVVETKAGAAGGVGAQVAATARPDGYTLDLGSLATHVMNGAFYSLPYDVLNDFAPISPLITGPAWRAARRRGATPNSRSNAGATASSAAAIAKKQAIGRASPRASAAVHVTTISSPTYW